MQTEKKRAEVALWAKEATSMNATNRCGQVLIEEAARCGDTNLIKEILTKGGTLNTSEGYPLPLLIAICNDDAPSVRLLADAGANLAARGSSARETPLHAAAWRSSKEIVAALVERGADVMAIDAKGQTPLDVARKYNKHPEVARYLREHFRAK